MRKKLAVLALVLFAATAAWASPPYKSVGLGFSVGAAFPQHPAGDFQFDDWDTSFSWGFYVNIPVVWTFHIAPSATLYQFHNINATDLDMAFKFIIPAWLLDLYLGVAPGVTTAGDEHMFNVGFLGGVAFNLFSNLDLFLEGRYKIIIEGNSNMRVLHAHAGVLWHF